MSSKPKVPAAKNPELEAASEAAKPKRKLYTPQPKQARVIERYLNGESARKIAREENVDRATVARVLTEPELVAMKERQQSYAERLGYKALVAVEEAIDSGSLQLAGTIGLKHLEGIGVYGKRGLQGTIDDAKAKQMKSIERERGLDAAMGQLIRMATTKAALFSTILPDQFIEKLRWIQDYAKETLEAYDKNRNRRVDREPR